jgi:hypothetical protein
MDYPIEDDARSEGQQAFRQQLGIDAGPSLLSPDELRRRIISERTERGQEAQRLGGIVGQEAMGAPISREALEMDVSRQLDYELMSGSGVLGYITSSAKAMGAGILKSVASGLDDLGVWKSDVNTEFRKIMDEEYIQKHHMQSQKNIQLAFEQNGLTGRYAVQTAQTAADIALFLLMMKGLAAGGRAAFGIKPSMASAATGAAAAKGGLAAQMQLVSMPAVKTAASRAAFRFATADVQGETEEERLNERVKAAGMTFAYMVTPALSGLSHTGVKAKVFDFLLNSGVTLGTGQYENAWKEATFEAERLGNMDFRLGIFFGNLAQLVGSDAAFSAMTKSLTRQAGEAMARPEAQGGAGLRDLAGGGRIRDNVNIDNVVRKYFENRESEKKPNPQGWEAMDNAKLLSEYYRYNTDVEFREAAGAAGVEGADTRPVSELKPATEAARAEQTRVEAEAQVAKAEQDRQARAEELRSPEYGRKLFVDGDKSEVKVTQEELGKEGFAALRSEWVAGVAQSEMDKLVATAQKLGRGDAFEQQSATYKISMLRQSLAEQGFKKKEVADIIKAVFPDGKKETVEEKLLRLDQDRQTAETKVTEVLEKVEQEKAAQSIQPEAAVKAEPVVEQPVVPEATVKPETEAGKPLETAPETPQAPAGGVVAGRDAQTPAPVAQRDVEAPVARYKTADALDVGGRELKVTLPKGKGLVKATFDVAKLDEKFAGEKDFYVGKGGTGASIAGRYDRFGKWIETADSVEAPSIFVRKDGTVGFGNGRHRYAWLRDQGLDKITVATDKESIAEARRLGILVEDKAETPAAPPQRSEPIPVNQPMRPREVANALGIKISEVPEAMKKIPGMVNRDKQWVRVEVTPELDKQVRDAVEAKKVGVSATVNMRKIAEETGVHLAIVSRIFDTMVEDKTLDRSGEGLYRFPKADIGEGAANKGDIFVEPVRTAMSKSGPTVDYYRANVDMSQKPVDMTERKYAEEARDRDVEAGIVIKSKSGKQYKWAAGAEGRLRNNEIVRAESNAMLVLDTFTQDGRPMARIAKFRVVDGREVAGTRTEDVVPAASVSGLKAVLGRDGTIVLKESPQKFGAWSKRIKSEFEEGKVTDVVTPRADEQAEAVETKRMETRLVEIARRVGEINKMRETGETKKELSALRSEAAEIAEEFGITGAERQNAKQGKSRRDSYQRDDDARFQHGGREPGPVTLAEVTKQVEDMARKIKGTFTEDRTSSSVVGTVRKGPMRIMVINEAYSEEAAGAVKRLHKGKFDYLMFVNPETGMRTTVNHEMGHVLRDVLNKRERELMAKIGYEVDSLKGDERFAEAMETTEGRNALAEKLKNAAPAEQSVILRGINRIVDFINTVFGTELKHFGSAREFETLAGGIREFGLLRNIGERAAAAQAKPDVRTKAWYDNDNSREAQIAREVDAQTIQDFGPYRGGPTVAGRQQDGKSNDDSGKELSKAISDYYWKEHPDGTGYSEKTVEHFVGLTVNALPKRFRKGKINHDLLAARLNWSNRSDVRDQFKDISIEDFYATATASILDVSGMERHNVTRIFGWFDHLAEAIWDAKYHPDLIPENAKQWGEAAKKMIFMEGMTIKDLSDGKLSDKDTIKMLNTGIGGRIDNYGYLRNDLFARYSRELGASSVIGDELSKAGHVPEPAFARWLEKNKKLTLDNVHIDQIDGDKITSAPLKDHIDLLVEALSEGKDIKADTNFRLSLDSAVKLINYKTQKVFAEQNKTALSTFDHLASSTPEGITQLTNKYAVIKEGSTMNHCAGSYANDAAEGKLLFFHIDGEGKGVTLALTPRETDRGGLEYTIRSDYHFRGSSNRMPNEAETAKANDLIEKLNSGEITVEGQTIPRRITKEQMEANSVRLQKAKKLKDSDIEKILVDRYGRGNIRSAWLASGEKEYFKWRKAEATKLSTPTADPELVAKVKAAINNQRQPKEDAFGREKRESKVLKHLRTAATNFSRPVFVADAMGLRDEFAAKSTGGTDAAGKTMVEQHKWEQENSSLAREITKGPRITMNVRVGGDLKKGGIRDKQISITRNEALTYAATILRKEAAEAAGKEGRAKTIEYGLDRFVLGESVGGNKERVFHFTKAQRDSFMRQIRGDAKMSDALAKIGERMEQTYNAIAPQYRKIHGVDLPKDEYYFHITRDISFLDKRKLNAGEQEKVENAYNLLRQGDTVRGLNPESLTILKKLNYSEAPIIVRNAWDNVRAHSESVAKYLESSEVKDWIDRNILAPEVREILSTTYEGRKQLKYFENLSETAGGQIHRERGAVDQIVGAYLKNATVTRLFNPFVWLKQPMSMPSSIAYFGDAKYLKNLYMPVDRAFVKQVRDANGTLAGRAISRSYEALLPNYHGEGKAGDMTGDYGTRFAGIQAKAANFGSKMMGRMDRVAIDHIIMAARQYTMDKSPELKGDAFVAEVGRHAAQATKMTQVATYGVDRTMMERNVQDPWRAMITYMWGARGAQFNLLMHSMNKGFTQHTPEALKAAGLVWLTAGLAQSAQIALVDSIRDGFGTKDDDDDESVNKAYRHGLKIMENMAGTIPLANEVLPAVMGPLYKTIGDDKSAQMQRFRVGKTGPLAGATADIMNIMSVAGDFFTASQEMENAKTAKERQRVMEANASKFKRGRRSLIRLGSEMFGVPVSQITRYIPEGD